jgi:eukaryotic-like serine/threonine-protein kinase
MTTSEAPPSIGLVGGKYQLVKLIGRGGMGSVWEARHASLGTPSAIKFIEAEYANSQEARSRFDKEAKAAATIQSKHAIQIYDHGVTDDGKPYIVMELLTGEPLDKRIERLGQMTLQDTARILQQVCRGLARAHERGIVHRDLKPENIFIVRNTDDDEEVAKVLDFGIAKIQNSPHSPGITSSTKTGAVLGTPFYMSPEQARGLRNVDHRTDVWSLGVIAFKCVTGRLPFDGESVGDLLVKICTAPVPIPSHSVPGLPQAFDTWFMHALEREPERRFSTVTELAENLAFAAGITGGRGPSSQLGPPMSATIAAASGAAGMPAGPRASYASGAGADPNAQSMGSRTPNPGGMTAAGFSSSQPAPGAGSSKVKWVVLPALLGLTLAGIGAAAFVILKKPSTAAAGVGVTQIAAPDKSAPPLGVASAEGASAVPSASASASAEATGTTPPNIQLTPLASAGGKPGPAGKLVGTKPGTKPTTTTAASTAAPGGGAALPAPGTLPPPPGTQALVTTPAPPAPTVKKPAKNDPGY